MGAAKDQLVESVARIVVMTGGWFRRDDSADASEKGGGKELLVALVDLVLFCIGEGAEIRETGLL